MSRVSRLTEDLEGLKDDQIITAYAHMQPNWLIFLNNNNSLFFNNKEARAFVDGAKAWSMYGQ